MNPADRYCLMCGRERGAGEWSCPCGGNVYGSTVDGGLSTAQPVLQALIGPLAEVVLVPRSGSVLLYGPKGCGKSTLALAAFRRPLVVSTEMSAEQLVRYGERLGCKPRATHPHQFEDGSWRLPELAHLHIGDVDGLVVDSISVDAPLALLVAAESWAASLAVPLVAVSQVTDDGEPRGGPQIPHRVQASVRVDVDGDQRRISAEKSRYGELRSLTWSFADGRPTLAAPEFYYVVVGAFPAYRLRPYPWAPSEVWDAVAAGKLTAPPLPAATAARRSALYGGWVNPPDAEQRREFCERQGVTWFSPEV